MIMFFPVLKHFFSDKIVSRFFLACGKELMELMKLMEHADDQRQDSPIICTF